MDLSFGLTGPQQWAVLCGFWLVLSALAVVWALFAYSWFNTKANWTSLLEQIKHRNEIKGR